MLNEREVAQRLLQINAIQLDTQNPFQWASGMYSPIYCDNRIILSFPDIRNEIKNSLVKKSKQFHAFHAIAGVATAGIAHGALLADALDMPFLYVRSTAKKHGRKNRIEGVVPKGKYCLVVEDLISTGGSSMAAVEALKSEGVMISGVLAIFSYQLVVAENKFKSAGCPYDSLSNFSSLIEAVNENGHLNPEQLNSLRRWRTNPQAWSNERKAHENLD